MNLREKSVCEFGLEKRGCDLKELRQKFIKVTEWCDIFNKLKKIF